LVIALVLSACSRAQADPPSLEMRRAPRSSIYDLGSLPADYGEVRWPAPPRIEREVEVRDGSELSQSGTRYVVHGRIDRLIVRADDVEIRAARGAHVGLLAIERGRARIRVRGGSYGAIELPVPAQYAPPPAQWNADWLAEDVSIEGVSIETQDTAFSIRGRRIAIVNSRARAGRYSIWCGDTNEFASEDLVIAGNRFVSAGPESTVRLVDVRRAVVVDNVLENSEKHDFRVHGRSDEIVFARNRLVNTGIMVGSMEGDRIGSVWLIENAMYHRVPSLIELGRDRVERLVARGNRVYSDGWDCFVCGDPAEGWDVQGNRVARYRAPRGI
jgi:hypothetical protein